LLSVARPPAKANRRRMGECRKIAILARRAPPPPVPPVRRTHTLQLDTIQTTTRYPCPYACPQPSPPILTLNCTLAQRLAEQVSTIRSPDANSDLFGEAASASTCTPSSGHSIKRCSSGPARRTSTERGSDPGSSRVPQRCCGTSPPNCPKRPSGIGTAGFTDYCDSRAGSTAQ
jgi:hypothetical protein